jgi:hypothetical protein
MRRSRSQPAHLDSLKQLTTHISAPSIPNKFQSFGYEETDGGDLRLQEPLKPGFSGLKYDAVGPGDYDVKGYDSRHHRAPASLFHKVPSFLRSLFPLCVLMQFSGSPESCWGEVEQSAWAGSLQLQVLV